MEETALKRAYKLIKKQHRLPYTELKSVNNSKKNSISKTRIRLKKLMHRQVNFTGLLKEVRYNKHDPHGAILLLKPAKVNQIKIQHIWFRVPVKRAHEIINQFPSDFKSVEDSIYIRYMANNKKVTGTAVVVHYFRKPKFGTDFYSEDYGIDKANNLCITDTTDIKLDEKSYNTED